jgi:DNA-binding NtrC family response regulator
VILAEGDTIERSQLWLEPGGATVAPTSDGAIRPLADLERDAIAAALDQVEGNRRRAAELLGIGERTLYSKIKKLGLD